MGNISKEERITLAVQLRKEAKEAVDAYFNLVNDKGDKRYDTEVSHYQGLIPFLQSVSPLRNVIARVVQLTEKSKLILNELE